MRVMLAPVVSGYQRPCGCCVVSLALRSFPQHVWLGRPVLYHACQIVAPLCWALFGGQEPYTQLWTQHRGSQSPTVLPYHLPLSHTHTNTFRTWSRSSLMKEGKMWGVNRGYSDSTSWVPETLLLSLLDGCLRIERVPGFMKASDSDLFNDLNALHSFAPLSRAEEFFSQLLQWVDKHGEAAQCYVSTVKTIQSAFNSPNSRETGLWLHFGWYTLPFGSDSALRVTMQVVFFFHSLHTFLFLFLCHF